MKSLLSLGLSALLLAGCGVQAVPTAVTRTGAVAARALEPAKFFGRAEVQAQSPLAFSTQAAAAEAVAAIERVEAPKRDALVAALRQDATLNARLQAWPTLGWDAQVPVLKQVMAIECRVLGFQAPALRFSDEPRRESYFDFDPAHPGLGTVILYPRGIAEDKNPYASLLLLIHEVRHAAQFQMAYGTGGADAATPLAKAFKASFETQKRLYGSLNFCDFCSLMNEYEAFQCGNYVVGALTGWTVDTADMGCLSSQYDAQGQPKLDLAALQAQHPADVLGAFNELERPQFQAFGGLTAAAAGPSVREVYPTIHAALRQTYAGIQIQSLDITAAGPGRFHYTGWVSTKNPERIYDIRGDYEVGVGLVHPTRTEKHPGPLPHPLPCTAAPMACL